MQAPHSDWLVPDWPAPANVRALFSTRNGGVCAKPYDSLNLGLHVGDEAEHVAHNRSVLQAHIGKRAVFLNQVHGHEVIHVDSHTPDALAADGAFTDQIGIACTVMVADCLPVLLCDAAGQKVAAAHAGWRGLLGVQGYGVLEHTVAAMGLPVQQSSGALLAWLGPCIGPTAFEVGDEVRTAFASVTPAAAECFSPLPGGKWLANLPRLAQQRLSALGIARTYGNDGGQEWCTVSNPSRFFSHRRDRISGRMAACIWLVD